MSFFSRLFGKKTNASTDQNLRSNGAADSNNYGSNSYDVPRDLFIDENPPKGAQNFNGNEQQKQSEMSQSYTMLKGIRAVIAQFREDFDQKGFDDALVIQDRNYMNKGIELLKLKLHSVIEQSLLDVTKEIISLESQIQQFNDFNLYDHANILLGKLNNVKKELEHIKEYQNDLQEEGNWTRKCLLSYERGFMKGIVHLHKNNTNNSYIFK
ncbi:hypothetical protein [Thermaurantimonas aggregans]|uniref:hypothetical protein n=1 Tax=Thermaurantimonas aggregans TaxID=2173829 RepID=UPI0023F372CB|nr:hypothetical protein [Thermaurantimonas aggregans]MCX8149514.1 hypothetical protein [Thermaurantimonas aggregans]